MNVFARSWQLTKLTFGVINKDKELLVFALLSFVVSSLYTVAMMVPAVLPLVTETDWSPEMQTYVQLAVVFVTYFGLAFIATFFNVCTVFTAKTRFEGGNATFGQSLGFAFSRLGRIAQWSLVSATVGLILYLIQEATRRLGKIGKFIGDLVVGLFGMAWSVITLFVVPVLVYENKGPFASIKKSVQVIQKTWGESLVKGIGLGLVQFLVFLLLIAATGASAYYLYTTYELPGLLVALGVGGFLLLLAGLVFAVASTVFNTALYVYAETGKVADGFNTAVLDGAVSTPQ